MKKNFFIVIMLLCYYVMVKHNNYAALTATGLFMVLPSTFPDLDAPLKRRRGICSLNIEGRGRGVRIRGGNAIDGG